MAVPIRKDQTSYRGAVFPFTFSFEQESGADLDVSGYDVKIRYFTLEKQDTPQVEVIPEVEGNEVSGQLSADQTTFFYNKVAFYEIRIINGERLIVAVCGRHAVSNVPNASKRAKEVITIPDFWLNYLTGE